MTGISATIYFTAVAISGTWMYWTIPHAHTTFYSCVLGVVYFLAGRAATSGNAKKE